LRYFLELSYDGTPYHGWQRQPNAISVQEVLEEALSTLLRKKTAVVGAGRTDTGVHAKQIFAHFDIDVAINSEEVTYKLNSFLPPSIAVANCHLVSYDAHARFDAIKRSYMYKVSLVKNPFTTLGAYYMKKDLDLKAMNEAARLLLDYTDFKCFSKSKTDVKTYNCDITEAIWKQKGNELIFHISADRFLRNMVRAIVGTLLQVGEHKINNDDLIAILKSQDRSKAGYSVPAHGLYLTSVIYPKTLYLANGREEC